MTTPETVLWPYWLGDYPNELPAVQPWQACALSVGIDPKNMNDERNDYSVGPFDHVMWDAKHKQDTLNEFERRLNLLRGRIGDTLTFSSRTDGKLLLHEFVAWLKSMAMHHPLELYKLDARQHDLAEIARIQTELATSEIRTYSHLKSPPRSTVTISTPPIAKQSEEHLNGIHIDVTADAPVNHAESRHRRKRGDALTPLIKEAVTLVGNETAEVWHRFEEWAAQSQQKRPLLRVTGGYLYFLNHEHEEQRVTRKNITDRIYRLTQPPACVAKKQMKVVRPTSEKRASSLQVASFRA